MRWIVVLGLAAALVYASTGIYTVGTDERAVVRRFGRVIAQQSEPGLHIGLPWGVDRVDLVKPGETKTVTIGSAPSGADMMRGSTSDSVAQFLSADQNLVNVQATVQYTIDDPKKYLFSSGDPGRVVRRAAESAITATLADQAIDHVLTGGKDALAVLIRNRLQDRVGREGYDLGIQVRSVNLTELSPPPEVAGDFTRAASARSERERLVLEARSYANERMAQARSEAQEATDKARAARDRAVDLARSDSDRFRRLLYEYRRDPRITATRMYLEAMAEIIPKFRSKLIVDSGEGVDVTIMRSEP